MAAEKLALRRSGTWHHPSRKQHSHPTPRGQRRPYSQQIRVKALASAERPDATWRRLEANGLI